MSERLKTAMEKENGRLHGMAVRLYERNHHVGSSKGFDYDYTCPSPISYPHQWIWDSGYHAIVLTHLDADRAKRELTTLFLRQKENGFVPCVNVWEKKHPFEEMLYIKKITQPPVIPMSVQTIYERTGDLEFVKGMYPKLKKSMDWFEEQRDLNSNGLIEIIHPWEDGDDRNPSFDKQLNITKLRLSPPENFYALFKILAKYQLMGWDEEKILKSHIFRAETVLFNSIYARSLLSMADLADAMGDYGDAADFRRRYQKSKEAILGLQWNGRDHIFYDLDQNQEQSHVKSVSSLMPLILPDLPESIYKPLIEEHLLNPREYWTPVPVASVARTEPTFNPGNSLELWRGPMWVNTNWFLAKALYQYGYDSEAETLVSKTIKVVENNGFREFYNPFSGEGYGQPSFGWSTLALDMTSW